MSSSSRDIEANLAIYEKTRLIKEQLLAEELAKKKEAEERERQRLEDIRVARANEKARKKRVSALNPAKVMLNEAKTRIENNESYQENLIDLIKSQGTCIVVHSYTFAGARETISVSELFYPERVYNSDIASDVSFWFPLKTKITQGPFENWTLTIEKDIMSYLFSSYTIFLVKTF